MGKRKLCELWVDMREIQLGVAVFKEIKMFFSIKMCGLMEYHGWMFTEMFKICRIAFPEL